MNIWYLHHYATPSSIAGLHRPFEFGKFFLENGNEMTVFASSYLHYSNENMIEENEKYLLKEYDRIRAVFVKTKGYANSGIKRVINMFQFYRRVKKVALKLVKIEKKKPDIIVASSPHPLTMMAGIAIAKKLGIPCVCEVRDFWPEVFFTGGKLKENGLIGKFLLRKEKQIYTKSDALVFLKEGDHTYINERRWDKENGGPIDKQKCFYINNGVDIKQFDENLKSNVVNDPDLENDKFKVIYCGTIRPVNNVENLVDVAKLVTDVEFLIYGTGSCVESIEKRIQNESVENVKLKGYIDNNKIPYVLSKASLNILNYSGSQYNWSRGNSSNKLFEYLASGKPVLSTVKMGYDILEKYNCGLSTEDNEPSKIAEKIKQIKDLPIEEQKKMGKNAREASLDFDIQKLAQDYLVVLEKTINKKNTEGKK